MNIDNISDEEYVSYGSETGGMDFCIPDNHCINAASANIIFIEYIFVKDYSQSDFLINQQIMHLCSGVEQGGVDRRFDSHIELLWILERKGVPLCAFNEIMNWANNSAKSKSYDFGQSSYC